MYSPQEPVAVALDSPAKSLDTQSVGTKQQSGISHPFQLNKSRTNTDRLYSAWSSVTLVSNGSFVIVAFV